jgi:diguanylate cyclase (GGDEF)-like protein
LDPLNEPGPFDQAGVTGGIATARGCAYAAAMIDVRTLLVFLAVADLMLAAVIVVGAGGRLKDGLAPWSAALAVRALALFLFAWIDAQAGSLPVAAALLALSFTLQAGALIGFERRGPPAWIHVAVVAAIGLPIAMLASDRGAAALFGGLMYGTLLAGTAAIAWQVRAPARSPARGILGASLAIAALAFYIRGVAAGLQANPLLAFTAPGAPASATFLAAGAGAIMASFGFLLLHKDRADAEALRLATLDPLTSAYNRRTFHEIAERELARARRAGQPVSIVMLDLDHFRAINDKHGQRLGDEVLQRVADVMRATLRKEDMLVRFGGAEFLVFLPDVPGPAAVVVAGRMRRAIAAADVEAGDQRLAVTVSAGVAARLDEDPESIDSLIARADEALALAKRRGRNRVVALSLGRSIAA